MMHVKIWCYIVFMQANTYIEHHSVKCNAHKKLKVNYVYMYA